MVMIDLSQNVKYEDFQRRTLQTKLREIYRAIKCPLSISEGNILAAEVLFADGVVIFEESIRDKNNNFVGGPNAVLTIKASFESDKGGRLTGDYLHRHYR